MQQVAGAGGYPNAQAAKRGKKVNQRGSPNNLPTTVGSMWEITSFLGQGSFGAIYRGVKMAGSPNFVGNKEVPNEVAIKFETIRTAYPQLSSEKQILTMVHSRGGPPEHSHQLKSTDAHITANGTDVSVGTITGFPHCYYYGIEGDYYALAMTLLGPSLYNLFETRKAPKWTFNAVAPLGIQMLDRIEVLHKKGHIHRDIKPDNFLLGGKDSSHLVYMIDFGLAKTYRTSSGAHQPATEGKQLTGTARYASVSAHLGIEQSRRDDLESLMYCLIFFLIGKLPWQGLKPHPSQKQKYTHILDVKKSTTVHDVCRPTGSTEIFRCLKEVRSYAYNQRPRYQWLRNHLISGLIQRLPIYRCLKTAHDGSITVNLSRIQEPVTAVDRIPLPDWQRGKEWAIAALQLEQKIMTNQLEYKLPIVHADRLLCLMIMGYPGEMINYSGGDTSPLTGSNKESGSMNAPLGRTHKDDKNAYRSVTPHNSMQYPMTHSLNIRPRGEPTHQSMANPQSMRRRSAHTREHQQHAGNVGLNYKNMMNETQSPRHHAQRVLVNSVGNMEDIRMSGSHAIRNRSAQHSNQEGYKLATAAAANQKMIQQQHTGMISGTSPIYGSNSQHMSGTMASTWTHNTGSQQRTDRSPSRGYYNRERAVSLSHNQQPLYPNTVDSSAMHKYGWIG